VGLRGVLQIIAPVIVIGCLGCSASPTRKEVTSSYQSGIPDVLSESLKLDCFRGLTLENLVIGYDQEDCLVLLSSRTNGEAEAERIKDMLLTLEKDLKLVRAKSSLRYFGLKRQGRFRVTYSIALCEPYDPVLGDAPYSTRKDGIPFVSILITKERGQ
jgi:hypothetical protein